MRLHREITGKRIYCVPETVTKTKALDPITGKRKSIRVQKP